MAEMRVWCCYHILDLEGGALCELMFNLQQNAPCSSVWAFIVGRALQAAYQAM